MEKITSNAWHSSKVSLSSPVIFTGNYKPLHHSRQPACLGRAASDIGKDLPHSAETEPKEKHKDIWKLFTEAQQNILYLNKQRIMALEELNQLKKEKVSFIDRIEQLQAKTPLKAHKGLYNSSETDKVYISSELLLRIDSMVLTGMIGTREASELRRLVMDSSIGISDSFNEIMHQNDSDILAKLHHFSNIRKNKGFHIFHICAEMAPVVSVGSLASYVTGLSRALQRRGNVVEVILPKYACLKLDEVQGLREVQAEFYSFFDGQLHGNKIWTGVIHGIGVTFVEPVGYSWFFSSERVYGFSNDFERFSYFSRASLDYIVKSGKQPDVIHIHNWETSIVGPLFWDVFVNRGLEDTRILLTCQAFHSQCLEAPEKLALCGLDPSRLHRYDRLQDNKKPHMVNLLKGGVVYSNGVIVMASMPMKGQIIGNLSYGLEPTLNIHKDKVLIAPHGFDKSIWDPSVDKFLPQRYSVENLNGKSVCKISLQQHLGLTKNDSMILVGCISAEISDVNLETLKALVLMSSKKGVQFIFLFSSQKPVVNRDFKTLQEELKDGNVRFIEKYDEALLHLMFSGCDIMLCPTFDDSVLQVPLKAMKYGAGLVSLNFANSGFRHFADHDIEGTQVSKYISNCFANMTLSQAIDEIKNNSSGWNRRITDAMARDFSWDAECCDVHISAYAGIKAL